MLEKFEDAKWFIRICKSKGRQHNDQIAIYKTLQNKKQRNTNPNKTG